MHIIKKAPIMDLTLQELSSSIIFDASLDTLLERLEVVNVLASSNEKLADAKLLGTKMVTPSYEYNNNKSTIVEEPEVFTVTHKII